MASDTAGVNGGRIAFFFLGYMGLFVLGLPALFLALYQRQVGSLDWPPPAAVSGHGPEWAVAAGRFTDAARLLGAAGPVVDARAVVPGATAAAAAVNPDGSLAAAAVGPGDMGAALAANYRVSEATPDGHVKTIDGMQGRLLAEPGRALIVLGMDRGTAEARAESVAGLTNAPARAPEGAPNVVGDSQRWIAFGFVGFWVLLQAFLFPRMVSWAAAVPPAPGRQAIPAAELESRLLGLAALDQPFTLARGGEPHELVADWKYYDAKWLDALKAHGRREAHRIVLRLDPETRTVRAQDRHAALHWGAGVDGTTLDWRVDRGIRFIEYQAGREIGLFLEEGEPKPKAGHPWRFDLHDMKQPLIRIVREAGWTWRPVVTFVRAFGG